MLDFLPQLYKRYLTSPRQNITKRYRFPIRRFPVQFRTLKLQYSLIQTTVFNRLPYPQSVLLPEEESHHTVRRE